MQGGFSSGDFSGGGGGYPGGETYQGGGKYGESEEWNVMTEQEFLDMIRRAGGSEEVSRDILRFVVTEGGARPVGDGRFDFLPFFEKQAGRLAS